MKDSRKQEIEQMIEAWKEASMDLKFEIESPFYLQRGNERIRYHLLIKNFGSTLGTLIITIDESDKCNIAEKYGYYCSALNPFRYSKYNRKNFIETLTDWGYFGQFISKPAWYQGYIYNDYK